MIRFGLVPEAARFARHGISVTNLPRGEFRDIPSTVPAVRGHDSGFATRRDPKPLGLQLRVPASTDRNAF